MHNAHHGKEKASHVFQMYASFMAQLKMHTCDSSNIVVLVLISPQRHHNIITLTAIQEFA